MKILAIDPATKCGFAHNCGPSGTWDLSIRRDESAGMRLLRFRGKLTEVRTVAGVDVVVYEGARHAGANMQGALVVQATIQGVLQLWCEDNGVEYRAYSPSEVKKLATGKGNANKDAMKKAAAEKWPGLEIVDDNHADALWLLELAKRDLTPAPQ